MKRYFNWKLFVVLAMGLIVLAATAFGLRHWQRERRASSGLKLGNTAYELGQWDEAANQLGRYLVIAPDNVDVLIRYADSQLNIRPLKDGNIQQAINALRNVLRLSPGHIVAATRLSELYLGVGMPEDAELVASRAIQSNKTPELSMLMAMALAGQRKFKEAAGELEKIIQSNPGEVRAYDSLGRIVEQRPEDFDVTPQFWFDEAVKINPDSALALIFRGAFHHRSGRASQAIADFDLAAAKKLDDQNLRIKLAEQFIIAGRLQQAAEHLKAAESQAAENQSLWRAWASLSIASGSKELMSEVAQRGSNQLERHPWDFMPIAAELYIRSGRMEDAVDCITRMRKKDIDPAATEFLTGLIADVEGRSYEAIKCWQNALELGGRPQTLRLALARTFLKIGDSRSAIKHLRILVSEQPKLAAARIELARALAETGKWIESAQHARIAAELAPDDPNAGFAYALARSHLLFDGKTGTDNREISELEHYAQKFEDKTSGSVEAKLLKLQLAVNRSDFSGARRLLNGLKSLYPSETRVIIAETYLLAAEGKADEAVAVITDSLEKVPDSLALVRACIGILWTRNEKQRCIEITEKAFEQIKTPSDKKQAGLLLAGLYSGFNLPARQCALLGRLCEDFPEDILVLRSMLTCPDVIKNTLLSQQFIDKIKNLEGDSGWQWRYEQARLWFNADDFKGNYPRIVTILKENLLSDTDDQSSRMLLAAAYEKAKDTHLAIATYDEAVKRSPDDSQLLLQAASAMYKAGDYDRADRLIRKLTGIKNDNPQLNQLRLRSLVRTGDYSSAAGFLEELFDADRKNQSVGLSLALLKIQQGQPDDAEKILDILIADDPNFLPLWAAQVQIKIRKGASQQALDICNNLVRRYDNAEALVIRGKTAAVLGQNDNALADFNAAVLKEPNNVDALLARSDFYRLAGRYNDAVSDIRNALNTAPDNVLVQKAAILLYLAGDADQIRRGLALLDDCLRGNPDDPQLRIYKARMLISLQTSVSLQQAQEILEKLKKEYPAVSEAWILLAETVLLQGRSADALDIVLEGLTLAPEDKPLLLLKARIEGRRSPNLAVPTLLALHELDPNDVQTTVYLADTLVAAGQHQQAMTLLKSQMDLHKSPDEQRILKISLGAALYKSSEREEASEIFDSLEKTSPGDIVPLLTQVRLKAEDKLWSDVDSKIKHWLQSRPDDMNAVLSLARLLASYSEIEPAKIAEDLLRGAIKSKPDSPAANYTLALLLQTLGRTGEAVEFYRATLKSDPENVMALNNLAWILCEERKQYREAMEIVDKGLKIEPNYVDLLDTRGVVLYRLGQYQRSVEDLSRCVHLYPPDSQSLTATNFHLARALEKLGHKNEAIEMLRKALDVHSRKGGLTPAEQAEAQTLLYKLSSGG